MYKAYGFRPYGSSGCGTYSRNASASKQLIQSTTADVFDSLENLDFKRSDGAFTICDYGAADGGTSMPLIMNCIKWIKERYGEDLEVHVIYNDQPINDYNSLFRYIHGLIPGQPSYYKKYKNVFVTAAGTSFYSQVLPSSTVHLGLSYSSILWLSVSPGPLDGAAFHGVCKNAKQRQVWATQAAKDWEVILLRRATELRRGESGHRRPVWYTYNSVPCYGA